jgi:hypothetical protein
LPEKATNRENLGPSFSLLPREMVFVALTRLLLVAFVTTVALSLSLFSAKMSCSQKV